MELEICSSRGFLFFSAEESCSRVGLGVASCLLKGVFFFSLFCFFFLFSWGGIFLQVVCTSRGAHWPGIAAGLFCTTGFL